MDNVMEALMVVSLCIAVGILLYRFTVHKAARKIIDRFTVIAIGGGFILGVARKALMDPIPWVIVMYIVGAWLCYFAVLFSFSGKEGQAHE